MQRPPVVGQRPCVKSRICRPACVRWPSRCAHDPWAEAAVPAQTTVFHPPCLACSTPDPFRLNNAQPHEGKARVPCSVACCGGCSPARPAGQDQIAGDRAPIRALIEAGLCSGLPGELPRRRLNSQKRNDGPRRRKICGPNNTTLGENRNVPWVCRCYGPCFLCRWAALASGWSAGIAGRAKEKPGPVKDRLSGPNWTGAWSLSSATSCVAVSNWRRIKLIPARQAAKSNSSSRQNHTSPAQAIFRRLSTRSLDCQDKVLALGSVPTNLRYGGLRLLIMAEHNKVPFVVPGCGRFFLFPRNWTKPGSPLHKTKKPSGHRAPTGVPRLVLWRILQSRREAKAARGTNRG